MQLSVFKTGRDMQFEVEIWKSLKFRCYNFKPKGVLGHKMLFERETNSHFHYLEKDNQDSSSLITDILTITVQFLQNFIWNKYFDAYNYLLLFFWTSSHAVSNCEVKTLLIFIVINFIFWLSIVWNLDLR